MTARAFRPDQPPAERGSMSAAVLAFAVAGLLPTGMVWAALQSPRHAVMVALGFQLTLALLEALPWTWLRHSPAGGLRPATACRVFIRLHLPLQMALLGIGAWQAVEWADSARGGWDAALGVLMLGIAVGTVTGVQGITFAHELGHSRKRLDRAMAWALMASVGYAHFMVEHYRGHHVRVSTLADPATARRGESLWRFLPRTVAGGWRSAWTLEAARLQRRGEGWARSVLAWATLAQVGIAAGCLGWFGPWALAFWLLQAVHAVLLLETVNYIEHYGLLRPGPAERPQPFTMQHAWNADTRVTNLFVANLQRHSDHHLHPRKPYETLQPLPGPQLPTGYAGCIFLALVPGVWFRLMEPRLEALEKPFRSDGASRRHAKRPVEGPL